MLKEATEACSVCTGHTQATIKALLPRLHYFKEGTCIVHHMFGGEVTELVSKAYGDAYLTAHFEVRSPLRVLQELFLSTMTGQQTPQGVIDVLPTVSTVLASCYSVTTTIDARCLGRCSSWPWPPSGVAWALWDRLRTSSTSSSTSSPRHSSSLTLTGVHQWPVLV